MELTTASVITQSEDQVSCELDGETVLLRIDTGMYYGYNGVATRIWELLEEPQSINEVCAQLVQEYAVDAEQCAAEVLGFLQELMAEGLIEEQQ